MGFKPSFLLEKYGRPWAMKSGDIVRGRELARLVGHGRKVLDIGCRDGQIANMVSRGGNDVVGIDISSGAVELARGRGIVAHVADAEVGLPFGDQTFGVVLCGEVIEHIGNLEKFFREIRRVLEPGGCLVLSTPNLASLGRRALLLLGRDPVTDYFFGECAAGHVRYFVRASLGRTLRRCGFRVVAFTSDVVNFDQHGRVSSRFLARLFPTWGRSLIIRAVKEGIDEN